MFNKKAQGTIEYLVIIAIVVVIALVVVGILLQIQEQGSAIPEESAKIAWKSAEPWSIADWTVDSSGDLTVVIQNNSHQSLTFTLIGINGDQNDLNVNVPAGATITRIIDITATTIASGAKYSFDKDTNMFIQYNTDNITGKKQYGAADIVGTAG